MFVRVKWIEQRAVYENQRCGLVRDIFLAKLIKHGNVLLKSVLNLQLASHFSPVLSACIQYHKMLLDPMSSLLSCSFATFRNQSKI